MSICLRATGRSSEGERTRKRRLYSLPFGVAARNVADAMKKAMPPAGSRSNEEKRAAKRAAKGQTPTGARRPATAAAAPSLRERIAEAKKLEALDRAKARAPSVKTTKPGAVQPAAAESATPPLRNSDFPNTYIKEISVQLDDPDHSVTLTWTGPQAAAQETGPFRSSPGAGLKGLNCDDPATSHRSGSKCTPKGTFVVSGFQDHLNCDSRASDVTWFVRARGIALHYFPTVPKYAASHGCVRLEEKRVAQLIQSNSRVDLTNVVIDGVWTKPRKQW